MSTAHKQTVLEKLNLMASGTIVTMSDEELDALCPFDVSNIVRTRPNPKQVGILDRWEAWIEQRDIAKINAAG